MLPPASPPPTPLLLPLSPILPPPPYSAAATPPPIPLNCPAARALIPKETLNIQMPVAHIKKITTPWGTSGQPDNDPNKMWRKACAGGLGRCRVCRVS